MDDTAWATPRPATSASRHRSRAARGNYFMRHWRGQLSLGVSYWVNSVLLGNLAPVALVAGIASLEAGDATSLRVGAVLSLVAVALLSLLNLWSTVGVLRAAVDHPERGGRLAWSLVVFILVGVQLFTLFITFSRKDSLAGYADLWQIANGHDTIPASDVALAPDGLSVRLSGPIGSGSVERLRQVLDHAPQATVLRLDSPGGRMFEGNAIAREVKRRHLDTWAEDECASACTLVLLAGHERLTTRTPQVGFHRASQSGPQGSDGPAVRDMVADYRAAGVPESFIARVVKVPASSIWYPTLAELTDAAIVTGVVPERPPAAPARAHAGRPRQR